MEQYQHFLNNEKKYLYGAVAGFFLLNSLVLATTVLMEHSAADNWPPSFSLWEPFVWEFSSSIITVALLPFVAWVLDSGKFSWLRPWSNFFNFLIWSVVFSLIHVAGMVLLREVAYFMAGLNYEFGNPVFGFLYEYRKDVISFFLLLILVTGYRSLVSRIRGEASMVPEGDDNQSNAGRILVKKLGAEFILNIEDIEWIESSGNYLNLHIKGRVYPVRNTMEKFMQETSPLGLVRTHRSYAINIDLVDAIEAPSGQSGEVLLKGGRRVPISKRYNADLRNRLSL